MYPSQHGVGFDRRTDRQGYPEFGPWSTPENNVGSYRLRNTLG